MYAFFFIFALLAGYFYQGIDMHENQVAFIVCVMNAAIFIIYGVIDDEQHSNHELYERKTRLND